MSAVGGLTPEREATAEIQAVTDQVKGQLESRANESYAVFRAIRYRSQVVAGTNYFIKVKTGDGESSYAHLRVFKALPVEGGQCQLSSYQLHKTRGDPITYF
ncbi:hypothetical protein JRQ81_019565 [Phrynocephalus forsythii]|uniref:Cystatin domain-containing protein n=1 Tax=Phrynocephalus forsythii TaxID=171643 RepID=A0A9Q0XMM7_9SAUR|nr:hypothetical protein JRQ81_019565 [Phrynocephalus forsythii]